MATRRATSGLRRLPRGLLRDAQLLLDTFGVRGSIYATKEPQSGVFAYQANDGTTHTYSTHRMFDLRAMGTGIEAFAATVGFGLSYKQDILDQVLRETKRYRTRDWVTLKDRAEAGFETTYNLTEESNHSYIAHGAWVSNCSEYMFLDNTACNLASLNLGQFYDDPTGVFDMDAYRHAIRLWTIVLEISVTMAHFPSKEIAEGSYDYRTLGLGYANLGSAPDADRHPLRLGRGPRHCRR